MSGGRVPAERQPRDLQALPLRKAEGPAHRIRCQLTVLGEMPRLFTLYLDCGGDDSPQASLQQGIAFLEDQQTLYVRRQPAHLLRRSGIGSNVQMRRRETAILQVFQIVVAGEPGVMADHPKDQ